MSTAIMEKKIGGLGKLSTPVCLVTISYKSGGAFTYMGFPESINQLLVEDENIATDIELVHNMEILETSGSLFDRIENLTSREKFYLRDLEGLLEN